MSKQIQWATFVVAAMLFVPVLTHAEPPLRMGVVLEINGIAQTKNHQLAKLDYLDDGSKIELDEGASAVLFRFAGAQQHTVTGPGIFKFGQIGVTKESGTGSVVWKQRDLTFGVRPLKDEATVKAGVVMRAIADNPGNIDVTTSPMTDGETRPASDLLFTWKVRAHRGR